MRHVRGPRASLFAIGAVVALASGVGGLSLQGTVAPPPLAARLGWATTHGPRDRAAVALTFDDGLNGDTTRAIARILEEHGARGTFFVVGQTLASQGDLARGLMAQSHLLANHSFDHVIAAPRDLRYATLARGQSAFVAATGQCPRFYRPPHGRETAFVAMAVSRNGMTLVNWDVEVRDWDAQDAADLAARVLDRVQPGSVVLLHDGRDGALGADRHVLVEALPAILDGLRARGLAPVRLDDLLGTSGYLDGCR